MALYTPAWYRIFDGILMLLIAVGYTQGILLTWKTAFLIAIVAGVLAVAAFILQSIGLYKLAKKNGVNRVWLAFVPFANSILIEELSGEITFFGRKVRHLGLITMIVEFISMIYHVLLAYALYALLTSTTLLHCPTLPRLFLLSSRSKKNARKDDAI